jgi:putative oxidoreductase
MTVSTLDRLPALGAIRPRSLSLHALLSTPADSAATVARLALGIMILPHALQKVFGLFGGYGLAGTMGFMTGTLHIPALLAALAIAAEFLGGLGLIAGLAGRVAAFGVASVMLGAVVTSHFQNGFFMNWYGALPAGTEGYEFHLLALALAVVVMIRGSGRVSADRALTR